MGGCLNARSFGLAERITGPVGGWADQLPHRWVGFNLGDQATRLIRYTFSGSASLPPGRSRHRQHAEHWST
jgi:hypothetical protein